MFKKGKLIKALGEEHAMMKMYHDLNDQTTRHKFLINGVNMWLYLCENILTIVLMFGLSFHLINLEKNPEGLALLLFFFVKMEGTFSNLIKPQNQLEKTSLFIESCANFMEQLECEENLTTKDPMIRKKLSDWPKSGVINFKRYSSEKANHPILEKINLKIGSDERIGIVSKSSEAAKEILAAILKENDSSGKRIEIDGIDISEIGKLDLRKHINMISTSPYVFKGTLGSNIDFEGFYSADSHKNSLKTVPLLAKFIQKKGLTFKIQTSGSNLTQLEKLSVSIIRAIIQRKRIILIECCDHLLAPPVLEMFKQLLDGPLIYSTVLIISRNYDLLMSLDNVCVLNNRKLVEFSKPTELLCKTNSFFRQIVGT